MAVSCSRDLFKIGVVSSVLWMMCGVTGCINERAEYDRVSLDVALEAADGVSAPAYVVVHHAWYGEGVVRHPLGPIEAFEVAAGERLRVSVDVPRGKGEGLVIYAWQDRDGDGVLCAPGQREEPAGVLVFEAFLYELTGRLEMSQACLGAERLYPQ